MRVRCEYSHSSVRTVKYGVRIVQLGASKVVVESTVRSNTLDVTGARVREWFISVRVQFYMVRVWFCDLLII